MLTPKSQDFECSTGVVITVRRPSGMAFAMVLEKMQKDDPPPTPPMVRNQDQDRDIANYDDPDYNDRVTRWNAEAILRAHRALLITGTDLKEVPEDLDGPESDGFRDMIEGMELDYPSTAVGRKVMFIQLVAAPALGEQAELTELLARAAGVQEVDVAKVAETFRSDTEGEADLGSETG